MRCLPNNRIKLALGITELSGGQWQKLAVARSFYSIGSLLILDEPNASMDVMTEAAVYRQYYDQIRKGRKIGILISHRLGSTRFCDRILVLKNGRIIQDGLYKDMYEAQSQWYKASAEADQTRPQRRTKRRNACRS